MRGICYAEVMSIDSEILNEFVQESKSLIEESLDILSDIESDPGQTKRLENYGNNVDRIMGGAKNLAIMVDEKHPLHFISDYCALCKAVGYKASQIRNNPQFYFVCVALLLDATETLQDMLGHLDKADHTFKNFLTETFLERLKWVSEQFGKEYRESVGEKSLGQNEIDDLLKKLGLG